MSQFLLAFMIALFGTIVLTPTLARLARPLSLIDLPNDRKIHQLATPRVGGIAMALSLFAVIALILDFDRPLTAYTLGAAVIVVLGIIDDRKPLQFRGKIIGQFAAALILMQGGFLIEHVPFLDGESLHPLISYLLTLVFVIGVTNAWNFADGLDGLAAGLALTSLFAIGLLAYIVGGYGLALVAVAMIGAISGLLRFNTYPATVFIGDSGSQLLGFSLAAFTIQLVEHTHTALAPALPLLILGVPLLDILWVVYVRLRRGISPASPDRNHVHYRLLAAGLPHGYTVALMYFVQALLVSAAFVMRYHSDIEILLVFSLAGLFLLLVHYLLNRGLLRNLPMLRIRRPSLHNTELVALGLKRLIAYVIGIFLIITTLLYPSIPDEFSISAAVILIIFLVGSILMPSQRETIARFTLYLASAMIAVLLVVHFDSNPLFPAICYAIFAALAAIIAITMTLSPEQRLFVTPKDLLVLLACLFIAAAPAEIVGTHSIGPAALALVALFYGVEHIFGTLPDRHSYRATCLSSATVLGLLSIGA